MNARERNTVVALVDAASVSLGTLLQVADLEAVTGAIEVGTAGRILLDAGMPTHASAADLEGLDAFYELFLDAPRQGELVLREGDAPEMTWGRRPVASLILEGTRRADEWRRNADRVIARGTVADDADPELLAAVDGVRAPWQLAAALGMARHAVASRIAGWLDAGVVSDTGTRAPMPATGPTASNRANVPVTAEPVRPLPAAEPAIAEPADDDATEASFYDHLDAGRRALRGGDLEGAHAAFSEAAALRPNDRVARQNLRRIESLMETAP
ncbi:MAG: DUF4388 domain-containing protein [Alphaproteobacteria bacterium]|nr:DUF4388 domain-containing protein [Alphaproteobacteria bacterium]